MVHHVAGHSPGHLAFELVGAGFVISGDTILEGITPNAVIDLDPVDPGRPFPALAAYRRSLDRLDALAPARLLPGHGPCIDDIPTATSWLRSCQDERTAEVKACLEPGGTSTGTVIDRLFPRVGIVGLFLAYSEVLGHLLELERRGEVSRSTVGGRELWRPRPRPAVHRAASAPRPVPA